MESLWAIILIQAIVFGIFCSFIAKEKGYNSESWFFLGFFFSFLAILALIAIPKQENKSDIENKGLGDQTRSSKTICPFCREEINPEAILCKHCRSDLTEKKPIIINIQTVTENVVSNKTKKVICPNCNLSEDILLSVIASNIAYNNYYMRCSKCHKTFYINPD